MLGNAITTELHRLAAKDRLTDLAAFARSSSAPDSARDDRHRADSAPVASACPGVEPLGSKAATA